MSGLRAGDDDDTHLNRFGKYGAGLSGDDTLDRLNSLDDGRRSGTAADELAENRCEDEVDAAGAVGGGDGLLGVGGAGVDRSGDEANAGSAVGVGLDGTDVGGTDGAGEGSTVGGGSVEGSTTGLEGEGNRLVDGGLSLGVTELHNQGFADLELFLDQLALATEDGEGTGGGTAAGVVAGGEGEEVTGRASPAARGGGDAEGTSGGGSDDGG